MKNIFKLVFLFVIAAIGFTSCEKDDFSEKDAINLINERNDKNDRLQDSIDDANNKIGWLRQDSLDKAQNKVYLSVVVIDASSNFVNKSTNDTKALTGATVVVTTEKGAVSKTTDASGVASFEILKGGTYGITISAANFTTLDVKTTSISNGGFYSMQAPLLSLTTGRMTVTGTVTYESDLTNPGREVCAGAVLKFTPSFNTIAGVASFTYSGYPNTATTDASGVYTIDLPADAKGNMTYNMTAQDVQINQTLLANTVNGAKTSGAGFGSQSVPTVFSSGTSASTIPSVAALYALFSAPTHTLTPATLVATIGGNNGISYVIDNNAGRGYASGIVIYITNPNTDGTDARLTPTVNGFGEIETWTVTAAGSKFNSAPTIPLALTKTAATGMTFNDDGDGIIENGEITIPAGNGGLYLTEDLVFGIAGTGTGAKVKFTFTSAAGTNEPGSSYRRINGINVISGGTGYANGSAISATVSTLLTNEASATAVLQTNAITSVSVTNGGSGYPTSVTNLKVMFEGGGGTGADYNVSTNAAGVVINANIVSGGSGYSSVPTATVDYTYTPKTATADVSVSNSNVVSITNLDGGSGYDGAVTLTFYNQAVKDQAVTGLTYKVNKSATNPWNITGISFTQDKLTTVAKNITGSANSEIPGSGVTLNAKTGVKVIRNIYLGTGTRVNVN